MGSGLLPRAHAGSTRPTRKDAYHPRRHGLHALGAVHRHATDDEVLRVTAQERPPALRWHAVAGRSIRVRGHVLADGVRRDLQAACEPPFVGETPLTPGVMVARHLPDECLQLRRDRRPSWLGWPSPEEAQALATPARKVSGYTRVNA